MFTIKFAWIPGWRRMWPRSNGAGSKQDRFDARSWSLTVSALKFPFTYISSRGANHKYLYRQDFFSNIHRVLSFLKYFITKISFIGIIFWNQYCLIFHCFPEKYFSFIKSQQLAEPHPYCSSPNCLSPCSLSENKRLLFLTIFGYFC